MLHLLESLRSLAPWLLLGALGVWLAVLSLKRSQEPARLVVQWLITGLAVFFIARFLGPMVKGGGLGAGFAILAVAVVGVALAVVWTPSFTAYVGDKFGSLYDGGDLPPDPEPFFSIAEAKRRQGKYAEAAAEVCAQLQQFPRHFRGWMLLAAIQAEDLHDLAAAQRTIDELLAQPDHAPKNVAFALTQLADWHLKYARDPEAARAAFDRILALLPDTQEAHLAHQRLAHLTGPLTPPPGAERRPLVLPRHEERVGLRTDFHGLQAPQPDPAVKAAELAAQLEQFPLDNQSREALAVLYAEELHRPDLAAEQLEQLIAQPHAPTAKIVQWLNLLADFQAKGAGNVEAARAALQRVAEAYPGSAAAAAAQRALATISLHAQGKKESQVFKLGSYEQRLGLKGKP